MRSTPSRSFATRALCALALLVPALPAAAQHPKHGACKADVERLCPGVSPGSGAIRDCLREKESQLSPECREDYQRMQQRADELKQSCQADVSRFCADVEAGRGALARCLRDHESDLSKTCHDALPRGRHGSRS